MLLSAARILRSVLVVITGVITLTSCAFERTPLAPLDEVFPVDTAVVANVRVFGTELLSVLGSTGGLLVQVRDSSGSAACSVRPLPLGCASWLSEQIQWRMDIAGVVLVEPHPATLHPRGAAYVTALTEGRMEITASVGGVEGKAVVDVVERARVDWSVPTLGGGEGAMIGEDGTIYVSGRGGLQAVGPQGDVRWEVPAPARFIPAIGEDGTIYLGSRDGLMAINGDGTVLWVAPVASDRIPAIGPDGTIYLVTGDGTLFAVDPTGQVRWFFEADGVGPNLSPPAIAEDGTIYFGSTDHHLYAMNPDGSERWRFETGGPVRTPSIGVDGTIYFANDRIVEIDPCCWVRVDSKMFALNPDGTERWSAVLEGGVWDAPAIGFDGTLYMGTHLRIYAFDPNGSVLWERPPGTNHTPIVAGDGSIYIGNRDVHALDADGVSKWEYGARSGARGAPAIAVDGTIYARTRDRDVYEIHAFTELDGNNGGSQSAPWPLLRGDRANTGRARGGG